MNKLIKNYIYNLSYQIFLIIVPLITAPYLTRILSSKALGIYDYINSMISIITTFGLIGLQSYGFRQIAYCRDNKDRVSKEFSSILILRLILLAIITVVYIPVSNISEYRVYYIIQYALIFAQFIDVSWVFIGFEDLKIVSFRNFFAKFITVIGIFVLLRDDTDLWKYFAVFDLSTLFTTLSVYPILKKYVSFTKINWIDIRKHIIPSVKLFIPQVATLLYLQFDKVMLKYLTEETSQVAYYSYAEKIINIPLAIITALGTVMMPRFANLYSNSNKNTIADYLIKTINFAMFLAIPMMVGLAAIASGFMPWYLGEEYSISATVIVVLSPICVLNALANVLGAQYLTAVNKTKELTISYYSAAFINLVINAVLIPYWGCIGAAIATVLCSFVSIIIQLLYVTKDISLRTADRNILKNVIASIPMVVCILYGKSLMDISAISTFIEVVLGGILYIVCSLLLKESNCMYIMRIIKRFRN